jgi:hypothetical protein
MSRTAVCLGKSKSLASEGKTLAARVLNLRSSLILLRVCSEELAWASTGLLTPKAPLIGSLRDQNTLREGPPPAKVRKLRFVEPTVQASAKVLDHNAPQTKQSASTPNLCKSKNLCQDIFKRAGSCHSHKEACIGYLDANGNVRHQLMAAFDTESTTIQTSARSTSKLASILEPSRRVSLTVHGQMKLALRIARSMLQYHSTPWWRSSWSLADLSYFDIDTELSNSLATLHIDTKLPRDQGALVMQDMQQQVADEVEADNDDDARLFCGIRNLTLYNLGVALLQIGRWETLETDDIIKVRKAAGKASRLGPRYDALTEKCLYCDFGFGDDLEKPQLQSAVYDSVICELEHMTKLLESAA